MHDKQNKKMMLDNTSVNEICCDVWCIIFSFLCVFATEDKSENEEEKLHYTNKWYQLGSMNFCQTVARISKSFYSYLIAYMKLVDGKYFNKKQVFVIPSLIMCTCDGCLGLYMKSVGNELLPNKNALMQLAVHVPNSTAVKILLEYNIDPFYEESCLSAYDEAIFNFASNGSDSEDEITYVHSDLHIAYKSVLIVMYKYYSSNNTRCLEGILAELQSYIN